MGIKWGLSQRYNESFRCGLSPFNRTIHIITTLAYMLAITCISLKPIPQAHHSGIAQQALNNFLHIPAYALLAYLISKCFQSSKAYSYILSAIIAISFGAILELLQATIPGRTASIMDIALNTTGVILSLGCMSVFASQLNGDCPNDTTNHLGVDCPHLIKNKEHVN